MSPTHVLASLLLVSTAAAQSLVADIDPTVSATSPGSDPSWLGASSGVALALADDGRHGLEPWRTDGTAAGTGLVADLVPGSAGAVFWSRAAALGDTFLFVTGDPGGLTLWRTDTSAAGTAAVRGFAFSLQAFAASPTAVGSTVYFAADDGVHGVEPWRSDGTASGTALVADLAAGSASSGPREFHSFGTDVVFVTSSSPIFIGDQALWRSDGSAAGTVLLHDFGSVSLTSGSVGGLVELGGALYFTGYDASHGFELWRSDGSAAGTQLLVDINPGPGTGVLAAATPMVANGALYFAADDGVSGFEPWRSDGTAAGTARVADINPAGSSYPRDLTAFGNLLLFGADDGVHGREPWRSDGTTAGTQLIADVWPGATGASPQRLSVAPHAVVFVADDGVHGPEPWRSDGTAAGTALLRDVMPGAAGSAIGGTLAMGGLVLFAADDGVHGREPWRSDGTAAGTQLIADVSPPVAAGSAIHAMVRNGETLVLVADDGTHGAEPWRSDGTAAGTQLIADLAPGSAGSSPTFLLPFGGTLLLGVWVPGQGWALLRSDGTASGTSVVKVVNTAAAPSPPIVFSPLGTLNGTLLLAVDDGVHGAELWRTDATAAGTGLVADIAPGAPSSTPYGGAVLNGELLFFASRLGGYPDHGLWKTDGTVAGTVALVEASGGILPGFPFEMVASGDLVLFSFADSAHGVELWRSDGSVAGTALVRDIAPGSDPGTPTGLVDLNGVLLFAANDYVHGVELWRSDGSTAGTSMVTDLNPSSSSYPSELTRAGTVVFFSADDGTSGYELWRSDGTAAGTALVRDLVPGPGHSRPHALAAVASGTHVVFAASDPIAGTEPWASDGTAAGTVRLADLEPGVFDSDPRDFVRVGTQVFFAATTFATGEELFVMPLAATGAPLVALYGAGCAGSNGLVPALDTTGLPTLGNAAFAFTLSGALPNTLAAMHLSSNAATLRFPPCTVYLGPPYTSVTMMTSTAGTAALAAPVPSDPVFVGLELFVQASVLDPVGARPITLSDALQVSIER